MSLPVVALCVVSPLNIGGAETNMLQIAKHLRSRFKIIIIGPMSSTFKSNATSFGIECIQLPMGSKFSFITIIRLIHLFQKNKVQIVHTHDTRGGLLGRIAAKLVGAKIVHTVHMPAIFQTSNPLKQRFYAVVEKILNHKFSDSIIFVSDFVRKMCIEKGITLDAKTRYIPNGICVEDFLKAIKMRSIVREKMLQQLGINETETIISWVGRMSHEKGLYYLIFAGKILKEYPVKYLLIGDGAERKYIESLIHNLNLEDRFIFTGFCQQNKVRELLSISDIFVLPSLYECLPYAILEAMATGLPCIVSDVGGNRELVKDGKNGFVVPPRNSEKLASAIQILLDNPELRQQMGKKSIELVQTYDEMHMIEKTREIYCALLKNTIC